MRFIGSRFAAALALSLVCAAPTLAGWEEKPCEVDTQKCIDMMIAKLSGRGWVGIEMDRAEEGHWILTQVVPNSPAAKAGLTKGDELLALNGYRFAEESENLKKAHEGLTPGKKVVYTVRRNGQEREVTVLLGELPKALLAQWIGYHILEGHSGGGSENLANADH